MEVWHGGSQAYIVILKVKWCIHIKFVCLSRYKSSSFAAEDIISEIFDHNCVILGSLKVFIHVTAGVDPGFCKRGKRF